jgi:hypothetical protein
VLNLVSCSDANFAMPPHTRQEMPEIANLQPLIGDIACLLAASVLCPLPSSCILMSRRALRQRQ